MPRFVTVSAHGERYLAEMAKATLEDAGIAVYLADTEIVGNLWHLGTAVGGVKVQVAEKDAERAVAVLREMEQHREIDEEELAREALAAAPENDVPPPPPVEVQTAVAAEERAESAAAGERDEYARRFYRTTLFATGVFPLAPFALYLCLNAAFGVGELTTEGRKNLRRGLLLGIIFAPLWFFLLGPVTATLVGLRG